ncbi:hypothetical protein MHU86_8892 [Fragilaria crotonensis]|nr:hypothetical protein MHU86_8892 [Fragilaria crotonensis]
MTNKISNTSGLFLKPDGTMTGATFWILGVGVPLMVFSGRWFVGAVCILLGLALATASAMQEMAQEDKMELRFHAMHAANVVEEIETEVAAAAAVMDKNDDNHHIMVLLSALEAMAQKMNSRKGNVRC